jgi:curved DNA-binding protein CbpA
MGSGGKPNYYELLEISPDVSQAEVAKAYQKAKQTYDIDNPALYSMFSPEEARELLKLIDEAYTVLGNGSNRRDYDQSLGLAVRPAGQPANQPKQQSSAKNESAPKKSEQVAPTVTVVVPPQRNERDQSVQRVETKRPTSDSNTGKTQLSTYTIDKDTEAQISNISEFNGASLEKIRLYKNISLEKMSELTRISRTYLTAVEANDYKNLPAAVFVRGFIVQIARALGLDEKKVAASYMELFKAGGGK